MFLQKANYYYIMKKWYAFYCRSRTEKQLFHLLEEDGFDVFLPLIKQLRQWSDRKKLVYVPIIPGYIFVRCGVHDVISVLSFTQVINVVRMNGQCAEIKQYEIDRLQLVAEENFPVETTTRDVCKGDKVIVQSGVFKGLEAIVDHHSSHAMVRIVMQALRSSFYVKIHASLLEKVP